MPVHLAVKLAVQLAVHLGGLRRRLRRGLGGRVPLSRALSQETQECLGVGCDYLVQHENWTCAQIEATFGCDCSQDECDDGNADDDECGADGGGDEWER